MKIYEMLLANAMGESGGGGGGGGGDFATAEVTFNAAEGFFSGKVNDEHGATYVAALMEDNGRYIDQESLSSSTFNLLMIEESAPCIFVYSEPVITGNASAALYPDTTDWLVTITGDCTITIS